MSKNFKITAEAKDNKAVIRIDGYISNWNNHAAGFKSQLDSFTALGINDLVVYINTPGGSCFEANEISNELARFKGTTIAHLGALCASAGTYIASKIKHVKAAKNIAYMIHKPMGEMGGNADEIKSYLKLLENLQDEYAKTYSEKTGLPVAKIENMWKEDYWMNAEEAKKLGFIDEIEGEADVTDDDVQAVKAEGYKNMPSITATITKQNKQDNTMKDKLLLILATMPGFSLTTASSDEQFLAFVEGMKVKALKADELQNSLNDLEKEASKAKIEAVLNDGEVKKKFPASQRAFYKGALEKDFEGTKAHIEAMPSVVQLSKETKGAGSNEDRSSWTYADYQDKDPKALEALSTENPEHFEKLFNAHYK